MGSLIKSVGFAVRGVKQMVLKERNFKIHLVVSFIIIVAGIILNFTYLEWLIVLLLVAMVLSAEIFNSAIEGVCDLLNKKLKLKYHETTEVRDYAAAAVLLIAFYAIIIGLILIVGKII